MLLLKVYHYLKQTNVRAAEQFIHRLQLTLVVTHAETSILVEV
jgi:hypothetical protein